MNNLSVDSLKVNCRFTGAITIEQNFLVCPAGLPLSESTIIALRDWDFLEVESEGGAADNSAEAEAGIEVLEPIVEDIPVTLAVCGRLKDTIAQTAALKDPGTSEEKKLAIVQDVYDQYSDYIDAVYTRYATHKELALDEIAGNIQILCEFIAASKRYILRIQPKAAPENKNYLVNHSMRSTVLAIVMGMQLALPAPKLVELGVACLLHEIGMLRLPPQLYLTTRKLTVAEKKQLFVHPVVGYNILKHYEFPLAIMLGVLEHHEKEDGSGYPRHIGGDKISVFAKIISVACSYEAISSPRTYKNEENTHTAIVKLIQSMGKQYNEAIVRALLFSISFYPIGAYVYLSDGRVGIVVDANLENPENIKNPIVQLISDKDANGAPKTVVTNDTIKISRALTPDEIANIKKTQGKP